VELYLHSTNTHSWSGVKLKHRDNFTFTFYVFPTPYIVVTYEYTLEFSLRLLGDQPRNWCLNSFEMFLFMVFTFSSNKISLSGKSKGKVIPVLSF
jgi:hypothetical protein